MKTRIAVCLIGVLVAIVAQARNKQYTRLAKPENPTFDIVVSRWDNPDMATRSKAENVISNLSDAVYEMTDGVHRLRKVRVYTKKKEWTNCDIQWDKIAGNATTFGSIGTKAGYIYFIDISFDNYLESQVLGGYVLGHEWVHYGYSLYDEYLGLNKEFLVNELHHFAVRPSIMNKASLAVGGNYEWLNLSVKWRGGTPPNFGAFETTQQTWQHAIYGKSGWETLAMPVEPSNKTPDVKRTLDPRIFYPELAAKAPQKDSLPTIELDKPGEREKAREVLEILWDPKPTAMLVIDKSGSMDGIPLERAKESAKGILDLLEDGTDVGVIAFDHEVTTVQTVTTIHTNDMSVPNIKIAIDGITVGASTMCG